MKTVMCYKVEEYMRNIEYFYKKINFDPEKEIVLFRGQSTDKPLLPKIARVEADLSNSGLIQTKQITNTETEMLSELKRRAGIFSSSIPKSDWDWLALAQHHGMSTRLLD